MSDGAKRVQKPLLGLILERENLLTQAQVLELTNEQKRRAAAGTHVAFGQLALEKRYLNPRQLTRGLKLQSKLAVPPGSRKRLGFYLLEAGIVTPTQLLHALDHQTAKGGKVGEILVARGWLTRELLTTFLKVQAEDTARK